MDRLEDGRLLRVLSVVDNFLLTKWYRGAREKGTVGAGGFETGVDPVSEFGSEVVEAMKRRDCRSRLRLALS